MSQRAPLACCQSSVKRQVLMQNMIVQRLQQCLLSTFHAAAGQPVNQVRSLELQFLQFMYKLLNKLLLVWGLR